MVAAEWMNEINSLNNSWNYNDSSEKKLFKLILEQTLKYFLLNYQIFSYQQKY